MEEVWKGGSQGREGSGRTHTAFKAMDSAELTSFELEGRYRRLLEGRAHPCAPRVLPGGLEECA
eukprot:3485476-Rhodomonas_salina.3